MEGTFCFIDVAGFTALTEAHGAEAAADLVDRFIRLIKSALADQGRLVDRIGDAALVVLPQPEDGVGFVRRLFEAAAHEADFPALRAGLHHGDALERDNSYYGATINLAARVAAQAGANQVVATARVAEVAMKEGILVDRLGLVALRNVREPVQLYAWTSPTAAYPEAIDPVCRMRVRRETAVGHLLHEGIDYWFCSLDCVRQFTDQPPVFVTG